MSVMGFGLGRMRRLACSATTPGHIKGYTFGTSDLVMADIQFEG